MIRPKKIFWQFFPLNCLIFIAAIIAIFWYGSISIEKFYLGEARKGLEARCNLIKDRVVELVAQQRFDELRKQVVQGGRQSDTRITVIKNDGTVIADSNEDPAKMDNYHTRPEVAKAFTGQVGSSLRYSKTLNDTLLYVAVPIYFSGKKSGAADIVLRSSFSVASLYEAIDEAKGQVAVGSFIIVILAAVATLLISRNISRPLEEIGAYAERFSKGDFSRKLKHHFDSKNASYEVVTLAATLDQMAEMLDEKIEAIVTHRNQLEAVFSSMVEAVIAIDLEERIISINDAAAKLFDVNKKDAQGKIVQQIVRNLDLQEQISQILKTRESIESEIVLFDDEGEKYLQTNVVTLYDGNSESVGVLVVLNDVTRLRQLETVRRDFVANVSHELRTPITSIRGYVETLLDGAVENREDAEKFLQIVLRQSSRLNAIIDDLLALSRIEQESSSGDIALEEATLCSVLDAVKQTCQLQAEEKQVNVELDCSETVMMAMNPILLEQAVTNLVVNAIRYSNEGGKVLIKVSDAPDNMVNISVLDNGIGISPEHLPRLFERFYRSDKARSRAQGGTGLGLAIVKHIAQAHKGTVSVNSEPGKGTVFTMTLPK